MEIRVIDEAQETIAKTYGDKELNPVFEHEYQEGDKIIIEGCEDKFVWILLDEAMGKSLDIVNGSSLTKCKKIVKQDMEDI